MFVQRPATSHISRHYTAKRTAGRNVDKENAGALPSKTPSKGVLKGGMLVPNTAKPLGKARGDEKGKGKEDDIAPKRLFASTSQSQSVKPSKSFGNLPTIRKTPGKTLRTPAPPKVIATPLPSASKPRRSRQSLTPSVPQIDKAQFTTPSARNWEEGGSFESVVEGLNELGLGVMEEEEEGVGEVEWMPPRSEPLPHVPIGAVDCVADEFKVFDTLPVLWQFRPTEELPPPPPCEAPPIIFKFACDDEDLEEPMFRRPKAVVSKSASTPSTVPRPRTLGAPGSKSSARPASTIPSRTTRETPTTRPTTTSSRPTPRLITKPSTLSLNSRLTTKPSTLSLNSRLTTKPSTLSLNSRITKQPSTLSLKPSQDLSHLVDDLPEVEISLDFGLDF